MSPFQPGVVAVSICLTVDPIPAEQAVATLPKE